MTFQLPTQITCTRCGAFAFPTDHAIRASQSSASWSSVMYKCAGPGCGQLVPYSPITARSAER